MKLIIINDNLLHCIKKYEINNDIHQINFKIIMKIVTLSSNENAFFLNTGVLLFILFKYLF